ncbi:hypothetical protein LTS18_002411, partial [Coniosporium uncinatum]
MSELGLSHAATNPMVAAQISALVAISTVSDIPEGIFEAPPTVRMDVFDRWSRMQTAIVSGDVETAAIQIVAAIDPVSEAAQRWTPILKVLSELSGVHLKLYLNPRDRMDELAVKRFFRYVFQPRPLFEESGNLQTPIARFDRIPSETLLTMGMDVPGPWLVAPKDSIHDLDNIKISRSSGNSDVEITYELEHILIEGHSRDVTTGVAPRGAQLLLRSESEPQFADTIIMANLGYFQFKANPGYFHIELKDGRSQEILNIDSVGAKGYSPQAGDENTE